MTRFVRCLWVFAGIAGSTLPAAAGVARAQVRELAMADRKPRFLMGVPGGRVPVDARYAAVLHRRVSLVLRDVPLGEALETIARASGLRLGYSRAVVPVERTVRLVAEDITVAGALSAVLFDTGVDVLFSAGNQAALVGRGTPVPRYAALHGRVVAKETGAPLVGASVTLALPDTSLHAVTSDSGTFRFADVAAGEYAVTARYIGYRPLTKKVRVDSAVGSVTLALEAEAAKLEELITTATGQQRRRDLGNAITTIRADSVLQSAPVRNLTDLLDTRVPGLTVQHTTGAPGDPAKLRLRGLSSVLRSNDPVVIVDGVRVYAAQSDARSGNLTNMLGSDLSGPKITDANGNVVRSSGVPSPSPLDQIDPNIIEKIEVFKGPSAATLYGADAANGVIVITTKRGKPGPTRWNASFTEARTNTPGRYPTGYYRWGHNQQNGRPEFCTLQDYRCLPDSLVQFQALNEPALTLLGQGRRTGLSLTASGGTPALTYSVTGTYGDETGLLRLPDFEVERFRTQFNKAVPDWMRNPLHYKNWSVTSAVTALLSRKADVTLSAGISRSDQQRTSLENQLGPLMATYVDTVNKIYYTPASGYGLGNATTDILHDYYVRTTAGTITFTTGLNANWRPRDWFTASGQAGLNVIPRNDQILLPGGLIAPTDSGTIVRATGRSLVSTFNLQGALRKPLPHGFVFETSLGTNLTTTSTSDLAGSASGLVPGTSSISGATHVLATDAATNTSVFGWYIEPRISGQRLSLSTGLRLDGGSAYGARITRTGAGGGGFLRNLLSLPKLNGSWVVSEEPWFPLRGLFPSLRLRGAYGQAQVQPGPADRLRIYSRDINQGGLLTLTGVGNTHLRPERSTEFEGGFDADLLDSRVSVELTAYRKLQVDALMPINLPGSINGGGSVITNIGNIRNVGLELTVGLTPVRSSALTWGTRLTYSRNNNTLVKLGSGVDPNPAQGVVAGYPVGSRWTFPILGFADQNGDGVLERSEIQVGDSMVYAGRLLPAYTTALSTNVALLGGAVRVTADFSYNGGATQVNQTARNTVLARALVDPTAPLSEQAAVIAAQALNSGADILSPSTDYGLMQIVSTFRFHSLSVNYRAPARVTRLLRAQDVTIGLQGANLGVHSTYRGKDPDVNAWSPGEDVVDTGQLPQPRTWQLAVFLQY